MKTGVLQPNGTTVAEATMDVKHVAAAVLYMASLPLEANVQFITVMATKMPFIGRAERSARRRRQDRGQPVMRVSRSEDRSALS